MKNATLFWDQKQREPRDISIHDVNRLTDLICGVTFASYEGIMEAISKRPPVCLSP